MEGKEKKKKFIFLNFVLFCWNPKLNPDPNPNLTPGLDLQGVGHCYFVSSATLSALIALINFWHLDQIMTFRPNFKIWTASS